MKVKDLIVKLQEFDPELEICIADDRSGVYYTGEFSINPEICLENDQKTWGVELVIDITDVDRE